MHELSLSSAIVNTAVKHAGGRRVTVVSLRVGRLRQVVPDTLDFFVLYSSVAAIFGSPGQGNHVAANAFMDTLAAARTEAGLRGLSINWGAWEGAGAA